MDSQSEIVPARIHNSKDELQFEKPQHLETFLDVKSSHGPEAIAFCRASCFSEAPLSSGLTSLPLDLIGCILPPARELRGQTGVEANPERKRNLPTVTLSEWHLQDECLGLWGPLPCSGPFPFEIRQHGPGWAKSVHLPRIFISYLLVEHSRYKNLESNSISSECHVSAQKVLANWEAEAEEPLERWRQRLRFAGMGNLLKVLTREIENYPHFFLDFE
ncbi:CYFIP-related Rac1 interactor A, partial [Plecturocebus cupreus]